MSDLDHCQDHLDPGFFKGSYNQIILGLILMIVHELSSLGGGLRSPSVLVVRILFYHIKICTEKNSLGHSVFCYF